MRNVIAILASAVILTACMFDEDTDGEARAGSTSLTATMTQAPSPTDRPSSTATANPQQPSALASVADAEAEAGAWPTAQPPRYPPSSFNETVAGSPERVCVEVQPNDSVTGAWRSGDFVAGNFNLYIAERPKDPKFNKLWWQPLHNSPEDLAGVMVRATRLDGPGASIPMTVFHFDQVAWASPAPNVTPTPLPEGRHLDYFYPSGLELPSTGTWMLVATMGPDWGCFVLEF